MTRPLHRALAFALPAALVLAVPAMAQEGIGTITGTLNLDDARWIVAGPQQEQGSTWRLSDGIHEIRLVATPQAGGAGDAGTLRIDITAEAGATAVEVTSARVAMSGDGRDFRAGPQNVNLTLTAVEPEGGDIALTGSLSATMTPGGAEGLVIETQAGRTLDGDFQATVPAADATAG